MRSKKYDDLDDALFELNYDFGRQERPGAVQPPLTQKEFFQHASIGIAIYIGVPLLVVLICYLVGH